MKLELNLVTRSWYSFGESVVTNPRSRGEACDHREKGEDALKMKHNSTPTKEYK